MKKDCEAGIIAMDPADAASMSRVSALRLRCFSTPEAEEAACRETGGGYGGWSGEEISRILMSPGGFGFMAGSPSPLGFILCRVAGEDCEVFSFGVDPQIRGAGIGARLLEAAMVQAKALTATRMILEVAGDNEPARGLYERMGFREIGRRPAYYSRSSLREKTGMEHEAGGSKLPTRRERADAWVVARDIS